jgi:hypothetical protein
MLLEGIVERLGNPNAVESRPQLISEVHTTLLFHENQLFARVVQSHRGIWMVVTAT